MDSLQGIPVEYKLDTFNIPRTGTTLCHPQNWLCRFDAQLSSRHLALKSPLGHFNGDNALSTRRTKLHGDSKVQFLQRQHGFRKTTANIIPRTSDDTPLPSQPSQPSHESISSPYRLHTHNLSLRDLQHKKQTQYSMLQIKTIPKNTFRLSASYFIILSFIYS